MEFEDVGRIIRFLILGSLVASAAIWKWLEARKEKITQDAIDAFGLVDQYRKIYRHAFDGDSANYAESAYMDAAAKSEAAFRIQMGGHLQQHYKFKHMNAAIETRRKNAIYDAKDILPDMMATVRQKAAENIGMIKAALDPAAKQPEPSRRRRRR